MAVTAKKRTSGGDDSTIAQRGGIAQFIREVIDELRKVVWPTWGELYRYTLVVIFTVLVLGAFIGGVDYGLAEFLKRVLYLNK
jgi:preprotein translocase subunit SecE